MNSNELLSNLIHSYQFSTDTKPLDAIAALTNHLKIFGSRFSLCAGSRMNLSPQISDANIIIIEHGCFSLVLNQGDLYIGTLFAPTLAGLIDGYGLFYDVPERPQHYIRAEIDCRGYLVPLDVFVEQCDTLNLWHDVAKLLAHRLMTLSAKEGEMIGNSAYSKIRTLLLELWLFPEEARLNIGVSSFLQRRSKISKSRVHHILSDLAKGGFIRLERGRLVELAKLPLVY